MGKTHITKLSLDSSRESSHPSWSSQQTSSRKATRRRPLPTTTTLATWTCKHTHKLACVVVQPTQTLPQTRPRDKNDTHKNSLGRTSQQLSFIARRLPRLVHERPHVSLHSKTVPASRRTRACLARLPTPTRNPCTQHPATDKPKVSSAT